MTPAQLGTRYTTVLPGDRVVAKVGGAVVVIDAAAVGAPSAVAALMAAVDTDDLATVVRTYSMVDRPAFAVVQLADTSVRALVRGAAATTPDRAITVGVFATSDSEATSLLAVGADEFVDRSYDVADGAVVTVTVGSPPAPGQVCGPTALHLLGGAVPGAGVVLWSDRSLNPIDEALTETLPVPDELPGAPADTDLRFSATEHDLQSAAPAIADHPLVEGRRCAFGHLNAPTVRYCARCGAIVDRMAPLETGPRPPLGFLVADDGAAYVIAGHLVVGRDPHAYVERLDRGGVSAPTPVVLTDRTGSLSRAHFEIRVEGWQVTVVDAASANGTWIQAGTQPPLRLPPGRPVPIEPGTQIHAGGRVLLLRSGPG